MGRRQRYRRRDRDAEYKEMLERRIPGNVPAVKKRSNSAQEDFSEVKEWRYLMSSQWEPQTASDKTRHEIDWDSVERVIVDHDVSDVDRCPICLHNPPVAPRLAKCGHVFCLLCFTKYQELAGHSCPFCQSALYIFKPLLYSEVPLQPIQVGVPVELELFARSRYGTTIVQSTNSECSQVPWNDDTGLVGGPNIRARNHYLQELYMREMKEVQDMREEEDAEFYDRAIQEITHELDKLRTEPTEPEEDQEPKEDEEDSTEDLYYYFYQPKNRLRTFLDPLDIKMLLAHYTQYSNFPAKLRATVRSIEYRIADPELLSKSRYLDYLTVGTVIRLISCDWSHTVSREVLEKFQPDLVHKHKPKSPVARAEPFHPEKTEEIEWQIALAAAHGDDEGEPEDPEASEYLFDRNNDHRTFGDFLPDALH